MLVLPPKNPTQPRPVWDFTTTVLGVVLRFRLVWRKRPQAWYLDLWAEGEALIKGLKVIEGWSLLWRYRWPQLPPGHLVCWAVDGSHSEPTYEGLGITHRLYWGEVSDLSQPAELAKLKAEVKE